ncbi:MAG: hypothetical protein KGZ83_18095 [Sulfuricella sp.]|nr:hypothetical protein [Sulfuricella sp.]
MKPQRPTSPITKPPTHYTTQGILRQTSCFKAWPRNIPTPPPLIAYHANRLAQGESGSRVVVKSK